MFIIAISLTFVKLVHFDVSTYYFLLSPAFLSLKMARSVFWKQYFTENHMHTGWDTIVP